MSTKLAISARRLLLCALYLYVLATIAVFVFWMKGWYDESHMRKALQPVYTNYTGAEGLPHHIIYCRGIGMVAISKNESGCVWMQLFRPVGSGIEMVLYEQKGVTKIMLDEKYVSDISEAVGAD